MADESNKSVVVWWPNLHLCVPDTAEWASLCLWHDEIIFTPPFSISESGGGNLVKKYHKPPTVAVTSFLDVMSELSKEGVVQYVHLPDEPYVFSLPSWGREYWLRLIHKSWAGAGLDADSEEECAEAFVSIVASTRRRRPLIMNKKTLRQHHKPRMSAKHLSVVLATTAISQLAFPEIRPAHVDDLLEARNALKDELLEFRSGILNLTWLLHQQVKDENDLTEIRREADMLVNTKIKAAVMSLECRMRKYENKRIRRMLFDTGRVLVDAAKMFLVSGWQEKLLAGGKSVLQAATEIDSSKPPENQVATYLYKLKRQLKS